MTRSALCAALASASDVPVLRLTVALDVPPSANGRTRDGKPARYRTDAYIAWANMADWTIRGAWLGAGKPAFGRGYGVTIDAGIAHTRDLDNLAKPIIDRLVAVIGLPDDRWCDRVVLTRTTDRTDCLVTVTGAEGLA